MKNQINEASKADYDRELDQSDTNYAKPNN